MNPLLFEAITDLLSKTGGRAVVALDGMCASGKTTLADEIHSLFGGSVIRADSFFLPPFLRTPERLNEPGGNFDRERFFTEVICGIKSGRPFEYGVFNCSEGRITGSERVSGEGLVTVEGSYCMRPEFIGCYDLKIFVATSPAEQLERIDLRESERSRAAFREKWIPFENKYHSFYNVKQGCDIIIYT